MVRGIFSNLQYAFGHFASDQIFPCPLEAIRILESIGLCVRAITFNGTSPNRKYFNLHKLENQENVKVVPFIGKTILALRLEKFNLFAMLHTSAKQQKTT